MVFRTKFNAPKLKTSLRMATARIKLLRNKRDNQLKVLRREIAQLLSSGQETSAGIRVEHIMREQNIMAAYDFIELYSELVVVRLPVIEKQSECPLDLREAIASLIYAGPRCSDVEELAQVRSILGSKYGKEFVAAAAELRPDCGVSRNVIEKLSAKAPSGKAKLMLLKDIAKEHNVDWDSTAFENLLTKAPEDLLHGSRQFRSAQDVPGLRRPPDEDVPSLSMEAMSKESAAQLLSPLSNNRPSTAAQNAEPKPYIHQPRIPPPPPLLTPSEASRRLSEGFTSQATQTQTQTPKAAGNGGSPQRSSSGPVSTGTNYQPVQASRRQESYERSSKTPPQDPRSGGENKTTREGAPNSQPTSAEGMGYRDAKEAAEAASSLADRAVAAAQAAAQLANTEYRSLRSTAADERSAQMARQLSQQVISDKDDSDEDYVIDYEPDDSDENSDEISNHDGGGDQMDRNPKGNEFQEQKSFVHPVFDDYQEETAPPRKQVIQGSWRLVSDDEEYHPRNESNPSYDAEDYDDREAAYGRRLVEFDEEPPRVSSSRMTKLGGGYSHRSDEHDTEVHNVHRSKDIFIDGGTSPAKTMLKSDDAWKNESHPSYDSSGSDDGEASPWLAPAGKPDPKSLEDFIYGRELKYGGKRFEDQDHAYTLQTKKGTAGKSASHAEAKPPPPINIFADSDPCNHMSKGRYSSSPPAADDFLQLRPARNAEAEHSSDDYERSSSHQSRRVDDDEYPLSPPAEDGSRHRRIINSPPFEKSKGKQQQKPPLEAFVAPTVHDEPKDDVAFPLTNESNSQRKDLSPLNLKLTLREFWQCETKRDFGELGFITGRAKLGSSNSNTGMPFIRDDNSDLDEYRESDIIKAPDPGSRGAEEESEYGRSNKWTVENGSYRDRESTSGKTPRGSSSSSQTGKLNWQSRKSNKQESESHVHVGIDDDDTKAALPDEADYTELDDGYTSLEDSDYYIPKSKTSTAVPWTTTARYGNNSKLVRYYGALDGNDSPNRKLSEGQRSPGPMKDDEGWSKSTRRSPELCSLDSQLHTDKQQKKLVSPRTSGTDSLISSMQTTTTPGSPVSGKPLKFTSRSGYNNPSTSVESTSQIHSPIDKQQSKLVTANGPEFGTGSRYEGLQSKRSSAKVDNTKSNLVDSKASSDSWGQQKVSAKSHRKTGSDPVEQLTTKPQKFKLVKPPEIDDIESKLQQKP